MSKLISLLIAYLLMFPTVLLANKPIAPHKKVVPYRHQYQCDGKWEKLTFQTRKKGQRYSNKKVGWICTRHQRK